MHLRTYSSFGEVSFLCNIPQPHTIQVRELCRVLRLDKKSFIDILGIYFSDGQIILNNLLEVIFLYCNFLNISTCQLHFGKFSIRQGKEPNLQNKVLESDFTLYINKHESELVARLNCASNERDFYHLKRLIGVGADPNKTDYDGRSPLVSAVPPYSSNILRIYAV